MVKWYLNRLKTMSVKEIPFRLKQMIQSGFERYFRAGKTISSCNYKTIKNSFIYNNNSKEILKDKIFVFGKEFDYSGNKIDWHKDIFSGERFPKDFAKSINIRHKNNLSAKNVWEINRLQFLLLISLNYNHTKDKKYLNKFKTILNSWIDENPYLIGVNWYSNIEVNIRLIVWYFSWQLLGAEELVQNDPVFKDFADKKWVPSIYQHCKYSFSNPSKFSSANNHLISEYAGLFIATSLWRFKESAKWNKYAKKGLEKEIVVQYSENGVNKEEAAEYIQFITDFFLISYVAGLNSGNPFSEGYKKQLKAIFTYIYDFLDITGNFPQYGDEDDGKCLIFDQQGHFNNFRSLLTSGALIFHEPSFKSKSNGIDNKNLVLFGNDCISKYNDIKDINLTEGSSFYPNEGHFIFRKKSGTNEIYMHFDAAPLGYLSIAAHGHADALSFILHIDGSPVIVDSGTYTYHTEPEWRNYFIGTLAHNTIRINKTDQATIAGPTLWLNHFKSEIVSSEINDESESIKAKHNGYKQFGITHIRKVKFNKEENTFVITDELKSNNKNKYQIDIPFHIHPKMMVNNDRVNIFEIKNPDSERKVIIETDNNFSFQMVKGQIKPEIAGWYSKSFMIKEATNTILCSHETTGDIILKTKIIIK